MYDIIGWKWEHSFCDQDPLILEAAGRNCWKKWFSIDWQFQILRYCLQVSSPKGKRGACCFTGTASQCSYVIQIIILCPHWISKFAAKCLCPQQHFIPVIIIFFCTKIHTFYFTFFDFLQWVRSRYIYEHIIKKIFSTTQWLMY